ncbi:MAG: amidohydrolase family protein [Chloroflexi bacterium]|nr:amidohydrolase family protein [Chloroflexota bacterium]
MMQTTFDTHVHIWSHDRVRYPMVPGRERPLDHDGDAGHLIALMDEAGVAAALLVQTPWLGEDNRYLVGSMRRYPGRFAALGWLEDPLAADAPDRVARQFAEDGFRGVRLHLTDERVNAGVLDGLASPLFQQARQLGIPVQFLNRTPAHPTILGVARRFPDLTIVVDHLGHPDPAEAPHFASSATFFALAEHPNVYVKVSNHVLHSRQPYPWTDLHDYQRRTIDAFGPRHLMWGSNWPMQSPQPSYVERLEAVRTQLPGLSDDERAWILGRTALSIWTPTGESGVSV